MTAKRILTLSCRDTVGIVAATSTFLAGRGEFITESQQYADLECASSSQPPASAIA